MSAAAAGIAEKIAAQMPAAIVAAITATITPRRARDGSDVVIVGCLFGCGVASRQVDIVIEPRMLLVYRVLEALHPGLHQNVLVAVRVVHPWGIRIDELGHAAKQACAFGA